MWFDDLYYPGSAHPEQFNPGVWDRGLRDWQTEFTVEELNVLAEFHQVLDSEFEALPAGWPDWDNDPGWHRVRDAARGALKQLDQINLANQQTGKDRNSIS